MIPRVLCAHLHEILRDAVVEVRVEFVDYGLVLDDRKQANAESHHADEQQGKPRDDLRYKVYTSVM